MTEFEYDSDPTIAGRHTIVTEPAGQEIVYLISADGTVFRSITHESSMYLALSGSLYGSRGATIPSGISRLSATASGGGEISRVLITAEGIVIGEFACSAACEVFEPTLSLDRDELAEGVNDFEVIAEATGGATVSERFSAYVPPRPSADDTEIPPFPPSLQQSMQFRTSNGLSTDPTVVAIMNSNPAYWGSLLDWGYPLTTDEISELEDRESDAAEATALLATYAPAHASQFAGMYVDGPAGGLIRVGFTSNQAAHLAALRAEFSSDDRLEGFTSPPTRSLQQLEALVSQIDNDLDSGAFTPSAQVAGVRLDVGENDVDLAVSQVTPALEAQVASRYGSAAEVVLDEGADDVDDDDPPVWGDQTFDPIIAGARIDLPDKDGYCSAGFGARKARKSYRGKYLHAYYLLTSGHCLTEEENIVQGNRTIGEVADIVDNVYRRDRPDAGTIFLRDPFSVPKAIRLNFGRKKRVAAVMDWGAATSNMWLSKSGVRTGQTTGNLLRENIAPNVNRPVAMANYEAYRGDSGGAVWAEFAPGNRHLGLRAVGLHQARIPCGSFGLSLCPVFTPLRPTVENLLGVTVVNADTKIK